MLFNKLIFVFLLISNIALGYDFPVVVSQGKLPEQSHRMWPSSIHPELLAKGFETHQFAEGVTVHQLIPAEAKLGWKAEIIDLAVTVGPHYHKIQNHLLVILEGQLEITCTKEKTFSLGPGQSITIPAGTCHTLKPQHGSVRLLALDMPGLAFLIDSYEPQPAQKNQLPVVISHADFFVNCAISLPMPFLQLLNAPSELDSRHFHAKAQLPHGDMYTLIPSSGTKNKWSIEVLEVDSLKDFQHHSTKLIVVLNGQMQIDANNFHYHLKPGQFVRIPPEMSFTLHSDAQSVRLLSISFP